MPATTYDVDFAPAMRRALVVSPWDAVVKEQTRCPVETARGRRLRACVAGDVLAVVGSRVRLEVQAARVEPLQDASLLDLAREGWPADGHGLVQVAVAEAGTPDAIGDGVVEWFADLWDCIYAASGHGWATNPRVQVLTFRRVIYAPGVRRSSN